jgi:hypothetical protein
MYLFLSVPLSSFSAVNLYFLSVVHLCLRLFSNQYQYLSEFVHPPFGSYEVPSYNYHKILDYTHKSKLSVT